MSSGWAVGEATNRQTRNTGKLCSRYRSFGQGKIYFASRIKSSMVMAARQGKRINLLTALPQRVGQSKVLRVQVGRRKHMHLRLPCASPMRWSSSDAKC